MSDFLKVNMNEYLPLRDVVFNTLRQGILKGELEPGERLMEVQLANRLGVSRTPIREAIRKLELEGLVVMIPRKGAEVAKISEKNLQDVLELRCALEELAIELACERISEDMLKELDRMFIEFQNGIRNVDLTVIAELDEKFHDVIYEATQNQKLIQMINNLREQMYRYRLEYIKDANKRDAIVEDHRLILEALKNKDVETARKAVRDHIIHQRTTILENLKLQ
ncbi:MAG TPA: GntR family transcriptional regulator [Candidatus Fimimorpha faecalis]|uniref:GntR family transcriptional regulator n=1 Tax=Candidatus Fimimorpha faecalis TaxID=2840824 RepID=A0A9D1JCD2_9FIRM|nr:GntR family transcriptional regulator [Candidatus Fimimorpha faecalis]